MTFDETANFESDPRFPTGPWKGYWLQDGETGLMDLSLAFVEGIVVGSGKDLIGEFDLQGVYSVEERSIALKKTYRGKHEVWYRGRPIQGELMGEWTIADTPARGGWRLWPVEDEFQIIRIQVETEDGPIVLISDPIQDSGEDDS